MNYKLEYITRLFQKTSKIENRKLCNNKVVAFSRRWWD